jgi:hypothetical protein
MAMRSEYGRSVRITWRSALRRASERKAPRVVDTPDVSWDEPDCQEIDAQEAYVADPWELEDENDLRVIWPSPANVHARLQSSLSALLPGADQDRNSSAAPATNSLSKQGSLHEEQLSRAEGDEASEVYPRLWQELDQSEEWDDLEVAEQELIEAGADAGHFGGTESVEVGSVSLGGDADRPGVRVGESSTEPDTPGEPAESGDEILDAGWEGETDWTYGFEAFDIEQDVRSTLDEDLGLYDYDEDAQQTLWDLEPADDGKAIRNARAKAATITGLLTITTISERDAALRFLTELFEHLRHPSTYRALERLAADGLDFETLQSMVALRRVWMDRREWWVYRYRGEIRFLRHGGAALTWRLAHCVCAAQWRFTPETMINEDWFDEWLTLSAGAAGYLSFPAFIAEKVSATDSETLYTGLVLREESGSGSVLNDDYDWHRRVTDRYGAVGQGFQIITPYDVRPGVIGAALREVGNERS